MKLMRTSQCGVRSVPSVERAECGVRNVGRASRFTLHASRSSRAFTMIEIAISLAVIGFALVAIIGILPAGMNVQKQNRQETIINQDMTVLLDAFRNGERGLDDLTNHVMAITNYYWELTPRGVPQKLHTHGYTYAVSTLDGALDSPQFPITNGFRILGVLATPKITIDNPANNTGVFSNHVVAFVRSMSGPASEKVPQSNPSVQELALSYKLICDVTPYTPTFFDANFTNFNVAGLNTNDFTARLYSFRLVTNYQANLHQVRLTFLWPLFPNGGVGPGRQVFRTMVGGSLLKANEPGFPQGQRFNLYYFQPRTYN